MLPTLSRHLTNISERGNGTLYSPTIPMKAYRTWFQLNSKTVISVKTPAGQTEYQEVGEICAQGSIDRGISLIPA